jgi:hypothetical protein
MEGSISKRQEKREVVQMVQAKVRGYPTSNLSLGNFAIHESQASQLVVCYVGSEFVYIPSNNYLLLCSAHA